MQQEYVLYVGSKADSSIRLKVIKVVPKFRNWVRDLRPRNKMPHTQHVTNMNKVA